MRLAHRRFADHGPGLLLSTNKDLTMQTKTDPPVSDADITDAFIADEGYCECRGYETVTD